MSFVTINPTTEETLSRYEFQGNSQLEEHLQKSVLAFKPWSANTVNNRLKKIGALVSIFTRGRDLLARTITAEMGKPITESEAEINKSISLIEYYLANSNEFLRDQNIATTYARSIITFRPLGPILGIMPWNFPLWQVMRFAIPSLIVGNSILVKHAENTTGSALIIESFFHEAGFGGLYQNLIVDHNQITQLIHDPRVCGVSLTGSVRAGRQVGAQAGSALKKLVLELGGSDAYLVLEDADLEVAVEACLRGRLVNSGQSCVAAKRFIIVKSRYSEFQSRLLEKIKTYKIGNPLERHTQIGPIARKDLLKELEAQLSRSQTQGARLLWQMPHELRRGYFFGPCLLGDVKPGQLAFDEELFGPVFALCPAENDQHAFELANQSQFGLGAAIFSTDIEKAFQLARDKVEAGCVFVNGNVKSHPALPFGGVKNSGVGREMGLHGMLEFCNIKVICLEVN